MFLSLYEPVRESAATRSAEPPPTLRQWGIIGFICVLTFVTLVAMFMIPSQTQFFLIEVGVSDPTRAGIAIGVFNLTAGLASLTYGRIRKRLSPEAVFTLIFAFGGAGFVMTGHAQDFTDTLIAMAVGGFSMGGVYPEREPGDYFPGIDERARACAGGTHDPILSGAVRLAFYSVPIATSHSVGFVFELTGYWLLGLSVAIAFWSALRGWRAA